ncbi:MAG: glycoside hydrolase family 31 protein [bacterium]
MRRSSALTIIVLSGIFFALLVHIPFAGVGNVESIAREGRKFTFWGEEAEGARGRVPVLEIEVLDDDVVKVHLLSESEPAESVSHSVVKSDWPDVDLNHTPFDADPFAISTDRLTVEVSRAPFRLAFKTLDGREILAGAPDGMDSTGMWKSLTMIMGPDEHFYGLGEKVRGPFDTSLDWRGRQRTFGRFGNEREVVGGSANANMSVPLLISTRGYGLFLDNHYLHYWDFSGEDSWTVTAMGGELRYYFLYGPDMLSILENYVQLTGRPSLPPKWALGLLQSKYGYRNWDEVGSIAEGFRSRGIPADAIILDLYWFGGIRGDGGGTGRMGSLTWDLTKFPEPQRKIAELRERGFKLIVIEEPYLDRDTESFREADEGGYMVRDINGRTAILRDLWWGTGGMIDFTNPRARDWWWKKHIPLIRDGVASWWTDLGEPENYDPYAKYCGDKSHAEVHNIFNLEWSRGIAEGYARDFPNDRFFILSRSGFAGSQRYGVGFWSNDVQASYDWLTPQASAGLNLGLSGMPYWGTDIGGFMGPVASDRLYTRWFQFGAFCPIFRPHGDHRPTAPFEFSEETEGIARKYAKLRYRLMPYIYTHAREAYDAGVPLMRPLVMYHPDDPEVYDLGSEYLFGPSILVAPVTTPGSSRDVYLPAGHWVDFWSNEVYAGPVALKDYPAPLEKLPLFVKSGAIIPMGPDMDYVDQKPLDPLTLRIYPDGESSYVLYEDDGRTNAYKTGAFARTVINVRDVSDGTSVTVGAAEGSYEGMVEERALVLEAVTFRRPVSVQLDGEVLREYPSKEDWEGEADGWYYDENGGIIYIRAPKASVSLRRRISIDYK